MLTTNQYAYFLIDGYYRVNALSEDVHTLIARKQGYYDAESQGVFVPIGFHLWQMLTQELGLIPLDWISVMRQNAKLRDNRRNERARTAGPLARGFNHLLIVKKKGR